MSSEACFKQLTRGVSFDRNKFKSDNRKFGLFAEKKSSEALATTDKEQVQNNGFLLNQVEQPNSDEATASSSEEEEAEDKQYALTLLGNISVPLNVVKRGKTKKKKKSKELLVKLQRENVNRFRNLHRIHVFGSDIPDPIDAWEKLRVRYGFSEPLVSTVRAAFPSGPTPVQMQSIPLLLEGRQLLVCAPTGSGKTAAFLLPIIHVLLKTQKQPSTSSAGVRAVIVAPTRELASQIHRECVKLCGAQSRLKTFIMEKVSKALKAFSSGSGFHCDILVTTPNRLVHALQQDPPALSLDAVEWLVVDESDKLFEAGPKGFRDQLAVVYRACGERVRRAMFSATLAAEVESWCKLNLDSVCTVTVGERNSASNSVAQELVYTGSEKGKLLAFRRLVRAGLEPPVLVFVQSKERAEELHAELQRESLRCEVIHSSRSQLQRDAAVKAFRAARVWVLICTELMSRGIDFMGVNLVVNYDFPPSTVSYVHRIGRTGRAGRRGRAVTFFTDDDATLLRSVAQIVKASGSDVPEYMLHMKKASRQEKRKLARTALKRESIVRESKYDRQKRLKLEAMIRGSKKRKLKQLQQAESPSSLADCEASASKKMRSATEAVAADEAAAAPKPVQPQSEAKPQQAKRRMRASHVDDDPTKQTPRDADRARINKKLAGKSKDKGQKKKRENGDKANNVPFEKKKIFGSKLKKK